MNNSNSEAGLASLGGSAATALLALSSVPNSWSDSWTHLSLPRVERANLPLFLAPLSVSSQYLFPSGPSAQR